VRYFPQNGDTLRSSSSLFLLKHLFSPPFAPVSLTSLCPGCLVKLIFCSQPRVRACIVSGSARKVSILLSRSDGHLKKTIFDPLPEDIAPSLYCLEFVLSACSSLYRDAISFSFFNGLEDFRLFLLRSNPTALQKKGLVPSFFINYQ